VSVLASVVSAIAVTAAPVSFADRASVPAAPGLVTVPGTSAVVGTGPVRRFAIDVERGVRVDPRSFADAVQRILLDPRGWTGAGGRLALQRVDSGDVDIRVTLARPRTVDRLCFPLHTAGFADCFNRGRAVINVDRWTEGSVSYARDLRDYRDYLINHEFGHGLGHGHKLCPGAGRRSFVMMQQTGTTFGCRRQPWPRVSEQRLALVPPRVVVVAGADDAAAAGAAFVQALGAPDRRLDVAAVDPATLSAADLRGAAAVAFVDAGAVAAAPTPSASAASGSVAGLRASARRAVERFVRAGGGVLALGSSAVDFSEWPWWRRLVAGPPCHRTGKSARVVVDPGGAVATDWSGAPEQTLVAGALAWTLGLSETRPCG
jgi:Protein of unknown function (DUF3152)